MFVHVFDHDNCAINHGPNGDGDAAQRHDVGVDTLQLHDGECRENADGETDDGDQGGPNMK